MQEDTIFDRILLFGGVLPTDFQHVFASFTTGPSQVSATVNFSPLFGSGTGIAGFNYDDFYVSSSIPEPNTLASLLSLGALGALRLRRKRPIAEDHNQPHRTG